MIASLIVSIGRATRRRAAASVQVVNAAEREGRSAAAAFSDGAVQGDGADAGDGGVTSASVTTPSSSATTSRT